MLRSVFTKTLRDQRRSLLYWVIGVAILSVLTVAFYPSIREAEEFSEIFQEGDALAQLFAGGFTDLTSPEGYLNSQVFSLLVPILFIIFGVAQGSGAIAAEEEKGTLDILLSHPTTRLQVLVQKTAAMAVAMLVLAMVLWLCIVLGGLAVDMDLSLIRTAAVTFSGLLLGLGFATLSLALGSALGKRGTSIGVSGAVALVAYFVYALAPLVEGLEHASKISPFHYYITADPLLNGLNYTHALVLVALIALFTTVAAVGFERRDLGV